jgi:RNA 2',3'-cyclic 3'-phosphodiesterase
MKRLFVAVKIEPKESMAEVYDRLKTGLHHEKIKWVNPHNIHLTLKFFGETPMEKTDDICNVLDKVAERHSPFELHLKGAGIFGSSYDPRVIWFGIPNSREIENLANDVLDASDEIGFARDRQNFRPHVTVGRIKFINDKGFFQQTINKFKSIELQTVQVDSFYLIESKLRPQGPVYEVVEEFRLRD